LIESAFISVDSARPLKQYPAAMRFLPASLLLATSLAAHAGPPVIHDFFARVSASTQ